MAQITKDVQTTCHWPLYFLKTKFTENKIIIYCNTEKCYLYTFRNLDENVFTNFFKDFLYFYLCI